MNYDKRAKAKSYTWFIEGPKERIIYDTGGNAEMLEEILYGAVAKNIATPEEAFRKVGLKCEDIDIVIVGHVHPDHIGLYSKFPNAKFIIQEKEINFARNPHPSVGFAYKNTEWLEGPNFEVIDGHKEIVPGVSVILTPGHSAGGQSLAVQTKKGIAIITGFCVVRENLYPPEDWGFPARVPIFHHNIIELYDSMIKVKEKADILLPVHEFDIPERIP